jgi:hypothetical protein
MNATNNLRPRWQTVGWWIFYLYIAAFLVGVYLMPGDANAPLDRRVLFFAAPLPAYLALYSILTGKAPGRFMEADRINNTPLYWFAVCAFIAGTLMLILGGFGRLK